ncbi:hypothetical protein GCM10028801_31480 [Nocardioides maradonensis]
MIDLSRVKSALVDVEALVKSLDGLAHEDRNAVSNKPPGKVREQNARINQELLLLSARLQLAAQLVEIEYWHARGEADPLDRRRR